MEVEVTPYDVGIIVGRFQVHDLHEAHVDLIQTVFDNHEKVVIILGLSPLMVTTRNPLDFDARKRMILDSFPEAIVLYIKDVWSDELWSKQLDERISDVVSPTQSVVIYGGRDSFADHYTGRYPVRNLSSKVFVSGTESRRTISKRTRSTPDFRAGVIWASANQYTRTIPTVDVAIWNEDQTQLLMARKPDEELLRFIGGFAQPNDPSYERAARREVSEEAGGIEVGEMEYIGSFQIDDWRYRSEVDKITTSFYQTKHLFGTPRPDDDIAELRWCSLKDLKLNQVVETHRPLLEALINHISKN